MVIVQHIPKQLHSPPQSPDINPIEHLWDYVERKLKNHRITSKQMLKKALQEEWDKVPSAFTTKLVASMPNRLNEVEGRTNQILI